MLLSPVAVFPGRSPPRTFGGSYSRLSLGSIYFFILWSFIRTQAIKLTLTAFLCVNVTLCIRLIYLFIYLYRKKGKKNKRSSCIHIYKCNGYIFNRMYGQIWLMSLLCCIFCVYLLFPSPSIWHFYQYFILASSLLFIYSFCSTRNTSWCSLSDFNIKQTEERKREREMNKSAVLLFGHILGCLSLHSFILNWICPFTTVNLTTVEKKAICNLKII